MNIKKVFVLSVSLYMVFIFNSCSSKACDEPLGICHFKNFEVAVPTEFIGLGNTTMFFTSEEHEGIFLIIGETADYEEDVSKNLSLFESTKFYKNKIKFAYSNLEDESFNGTLYNERLDKNYYFVGRLIQNPELYIFGMCEFETDEEYTRELVADVYSSLVVNDE